ncbi:hypothetical protein DJ87_5477 [Bacillus cereus]|uniref:Uncharacterized protein n=3 Tax=Bacillus cereus TaxID=1396 RepID=A1BYR2_BACCE|nr:hypothetical protein BcAH187_pCER270_0123 [Bacillus cereus]ACI30256.1 conserved hypothetical protein [Bacillus cereus H3081.97]ACJ82704.1 conserved hypothetical protein [Bacillus cereus AH187]ACK92691.1 conserved hypothetical protein [Bacillus cereus AH820]KFK72265.1 hypothetical protein DJ87_5477 [Bacillus cereus]
MDLAVNKLVNVSNQSKTIILNKNVSLTQREIEIYQAILK